MGCFTTAFHVEFAEQLGPDLYKYIADKCYKVGEPLGLQFLYPEKTDSIRDAFDAWLSGLPPALRQRENTFNDLSNLLSSLVEQTARRLVGLDAVGFTTCYAQLF